MPIISHQRSCGKLCFAGSEWPCHLQHGDYNPLFLIPLRQASSWCFPICILSRFWQSVTSPSLDPLTETWTAKMGRSHFCPLDGSPCRRPVAVLLLRVSLFLLLVGFDLVIWVARFLLMQSLVSLNHFPFLEKKSSTAAAGGFLSSPPCRGKSFMENYRWVKLEALTWTLVDFFTKLPFSTPKKKKKKSVFSYVLVNSFSQWSLLMMRQIVISLTALTYCFNPSCQVLCFLYTHAAVIDLSPFTLDELAQAFHDKVNHLLSIYHPRFCSSRRIKPFFFF